MQGTNLVTMAHSVIRRYGKAKQKRMSAAEKDRPVFSLGQRFKLAREIAGLQQKELAARAKMRPAQLSLLENGFNIESRHYAHVAKVLGFRSAVELIELTNDALTRKLLRLWRGMDEATREAAFRKLKVWLIED
jgi:transcriptional regulator with XRE-family HTH domain